MKTTIQSIIKSFGYAFDGIKYAIQTQKNMHIHIFIGLIVLFTSFLVNCSQLEIAILFTIIGLVISLEIMNTAIEVMINLVSPTNQPLAKISKDLGAASVLIAAIVAVIVGLLILFPRLFHLLQLLR